MAVLTKPNESYSITMRVEIDNKPGMLGKVTTAIGNAGGDIGAVDPEEVKAMIDLQLLTAARPGEGWAVLAGEYMESWARACPLPLGDAWEPYPVARRLLSWALASALLPELVLTGWALVLLVVLAPVTVTAT